MIYILNQASSWPWNRHACVCQCVIIKLGGNDYATVFNLIDFLVKTQPTSTQFNATRVEVSHSSPLEPTPTPHRPSTTKLTNLQRYNYFQISPPWNYLVWQIEKSDPIWLSWNVAVNYLNELRADKVSVSPKIQENIQAVKYFQYIF